MSSDKLDKSYSYKIGFYLLVLALPLVLMTLLVAIAPYSAVSPLSDNPSKFLFFILYFLPGLIMARSVSDSWRRTIGVGIAYAFISPAYYFYAIEYACKLGGNCY